MAENVFIFGAGASRTAGAPLMHDFMDQAEQLWRSGQVQQYASHFQNIFGAISKLQVIHSKAKFDIVNLEALFSAFEMGRTIGVLPGIDKSEIDNLIRSLKIVIAVTLENSLRLPTKGLINQGKRIAPPMDYQKFAELIKRKNIGSQTAIITFNYDLGLDFALHYNTIAFDYCTELSVIGMKYLKLHGSLNWLLDNGSLKVWHLNDYFSTVRYRNLESSDVKFNFLGNMEHFRRKVAASPSAETMIVPPSWNKAGYHNEISVIWEHAAAALKEARNIYVIGFSLPETDSFFRSLYALGTAGGDPLKRFWVFNPDPTVEKRFRDLIGPGAEQRFQFFDYTFTKASDYLQELL